MNLPSLTAFRPNVVTEIPRSAQNFSMRLIMSWVSLMAPSKWAFAHLSMGYFPSAMGKAFCERAGDG